jgi:hypothetical protein
VLEVVLTITPDDSVPTPAVGFDSTVISFLNEVGASIDVDIYYGVPDGPVSEGGLHLESIAATDGLTESEFHGVIHK